MERPRSALQGATGFGPGKSRPGGRSRELLADVGRSAREVAERMNAVLAGQVVYADGLPWDNFWLGELFHAAELER